MLKKVEPQDRPFVVVLLLIAVLLMLMMSFAENPQQPTTNYTQAQPNGTSPSKQPESISFWQRTVRDPINLFTGVLAVFTIILAEASIYEGVLTQKSVGIAQRALTELEAPFIFIDVIETGMDSTDGMARLAAGKRFTFSITNYGRTPARLTELMTDYPIEDVPNSPTPINPLVNKGRGLPAGVISAAGSPYIESENLLAVAEVDKLQGERAYKTYWLFFYGYARYVDIFGVHYITGFCHRYDALTNHFVRVGDEQYNYTRKET